jgi:hypothetical protein
MKKKPGPKEKPLSEKKRVIRMFIKGKNYVKAKKDAALLEHKYNSE